MVSAIAKFVTAKNNSEHLVHSDRRIFLSLLPKLSQCYELTTSATLKLDAGWMVVGVFLSLREVVHFNFPSVFKVSCVSCLISVVPFRSDKTQWRKYLPRGCWGGSADPILKWFIIAAPITEIWSPLMLISRTSSGRGEFEKFLATMDGVLFTIATLENAALIDIVEKMIMCPWNGLVDLVYYVHHLGMVTTNYTTGRVVNQTGRVYAWGYIRVTWVNPDPIRLRILSEQFWS